jgi:hypothetical protein
MQSQSSPARTDVTGTRAHGVPFSSNALRLSPRQWIIAIALIGLLFWLIPIVWRWAEPFEPGPDARIPYSLSDDYWLYNRYCRRAAAEDATLVIGDSVIWGHFVAKEETLSHYLSELGEGRFVNLGVDGTHPAALAGLMEYYGEQVSGKNVLLHCNLLWMSSKKADLQTDKEFALQHAKLVPQFFPRIPCYTEPLWGRLCIAVERNVPFFGWMGHLRAAYFEKKDFYAWTVEHPYDDPLRQPPPEDLPSPPPTPEPWTQRRIEKSSPSWVELETSFQWSCFRRTVQTLQARGNRVFVVVGPFNEHMLKDAGLRKYRDRKAGVAAWLAENGIPHFVPPPLPSDYYADASHPLRAGYALLAKQLLQTEAFRRFQQAAD